MRKSLPTICIFLLLPLFAAAQTQHTRTYRWVDENGVIHYGDTIPAEYAELPKQVLNEHAVTVQHLAGKKTPEQIERERLAAEKKRILELQRRRDLALLATYGDVQEILMHRDRRVELFQAQARVTELYLRNTRRRLDSLETLAARFKPYSEDPGAPMIDPDHVDDMDTTKQTIARHQHNLKKFENNQVRVIKRFDGDIARFKTLKGID